MKNIESVNKIQQVIADMTKRSAVSSEDAATTSIFPVAIDPVEGINLRDWIIREKAHQSIEIGLAYGFSTLFICEGLFSSGHSNPRHVAIDPFQNGFKNAGLQSLEKAGVREMVEFFQDESQLVLPKFLAERESFDFAFVDGSHFFERVFLDLIFLGRLVQSGKIIFVDDFQLPAIAKSVGFCVSNLGWKIEELSAKDDVHQWAVLRLPAEPIARTFRDFVDF